jgi:hypothetical protein
MASTTVREAILEVVDRKIRRAAETPPPARCPGDCRAHLLRTIRTELARLLGAPQKSA